MTKKETWNKYQNEYRKNHYKQIAVYLDPILVDNIKKKLKKENISLTTFIRDTITNYLEK